MGMRESARKWLSVVCLATGICLLPVSASAFYVAFNEKDLGNFPSEWKARESAGKDVYSVQRDGSGVFLHAESVDNAYMIGHQMSVDLKEYSFLQFSWRPLDLPTGGNEEAKKTNDGALGVYIVFEGWSVPPRTIKYVWSSTLPEGSETVSPYSNRAKIVVLRSGRDGVGQWKDESVNVLEDYKRLFGSDDVPRVRAIGVLTDSDNTDTHSSGDYRFFRFSKAGEKLASSGR